jgi:hypothetical protein
MGESLLPDCLLSGIVTMSRPAGTASAGNIRNLSQVEHVIGILLHMVVSDESAVAVYTFPTLSH